MTTKAKQTEIPTLLKGVSPEFTDLAKQMLNGKKFNLTTPKGVVVAQLKPHNESNVIFDQGKNVEYGEYDIVSDGLTGNVKAFQNTTFRVWTNDLLGNLARTRVKFENVELVK